MAHKLPDLPFANDALEPHISARTLSFHHGKHHAGYVSKLNAALEGTGLENKPLEELIRETDPTNAAIYNNAAQHFNHSFYWNCLTAPANSRMDATVEKALAAAFGSVEAFKEAFTKEAVGHFGSGWAWLVRNADGSLAVVSTHDAFCPLSNGQKPLLTCDVWEHAYYLDYQNARPKYVEAFWKIVNWDFVAENLG
jgi:Fe-Mn family superoxide dismutase